MPRDPAPVSVIIPAYNAALSIGRALASVAAQSLPAAEVIIVDDGSTDSTVDIASAQQDILGTTRLVVVRQQNQGAGAARNLALAEASQPYVAFLDADDEWLPAKLERAMAVMAEDDYVLVAHDYMDTSEAGDTHIDCAGRFQANTDPYVGLYIKGYIPSISVVARRAAVVAAGGFDETLRNAQDFELWLALLADPAHKFTVFGEALARYHHTAGSIMTHTDRRITCCTEIALRYVPALRARGAAPLKALLMRIAVIYIEAARARPDARLQYAMRGIVGGAHILLRAIFSDTPARKVAR